MNDISQKQNPWHKCSYRELLNKHQKITNELRSDMLKNGLSKSYIDGYIRDVLKPIFDFEILEWKAKNT